ncbi:MAG: excinuclease ABC subunit C [Bacteroidales bacterium]|nr:excinuclease ABC subunit C [Bacteroidales bacterium]
MKKEELKNIALNLPQKPGVYQFFDAEGTIIYVGKAKNLKNRVNSYFNKTVDRTKTVILVRQISEIKYITVETENDALLLENTLIKKYKPKYNIQLKDDKSYPWIVIKNEPFPRVYYTRNLTKDGSEYFGPYTSLNLVRTIVSMFKKLYKTRTCKLSLNIDQIRAGKFKECLQFHIKNCQGPCISQQTEVDYLNNIDQIRKILKGDIHIVINHVKQQMLSAAEELNFEKAEELKQKLELLENYQSRSTVVNTSVDNIDIFSISSSTKYSFVNFLKLVSGKIVQAYSYEIKKQLEESDKEVLEHAIINIRENIQQGVSNAKEIIVPFKIDLTIEGVSFKVPQRGIKHELLALSERNLKYYRMEKERQRNQIDPNRRTNEILERMQKDLNLESLPIHIECFDNSNLQGTNAVSSCVVFKNTKPSKKDYRKFNIKTVIGPDDFASMKEVVFRRYKRMIDENLSLPQLIIIDGGKGQLSAALESLVELEIDDKVEIISIAKKLEEIFRPNDPYPLYLDKNSPTLKIIQQARDEAHRFGITFHRQKRGKEMTKSQLTEINGIGEKSMQRLIQHFGSVSRIKEASIDELYEMLGTSKGKLVYDFFNKKDEE